MAALSENESCSSIEKDKQIQEDDLWDDDVDYDVLVQSDTCGQINETEETAEVQENSNVVKNLSEQGTPLERFRPGYLWVSDFTRQNWCEQQLYYSFTVPGIVEENPVMTEGSNLHLARELAVHDTVQVKVTSNEDIWAIKVLNLLSTVQGFLNGVTLAREVPIFGAPFGQDVFVVGLIDELRFDPVSHSLDLSELKTKMYKSPPSQAQKSQHRLQVQLYKKLFDDLVQGNVSKAMISKHLRVNLGQEFGEGVTRELDHHKIDGRNLDALLEILFLKIQCLTCINQLHIEYVLQDTKETLYHHTVTYSLDDLSRWFLDYLRFWRGQRSAVGVDIEEAWKCQKCDFADICDWRRRKSQEYSSRNKLKNS